MEHIPVWLHKFSKEKSVVSHRGDMDGVGSRVPRIEIIRSSHYSSLLGTIDSISVMTHAGNASIVREVSCN
jgi:hypothetical protein